MIYTDVDVMALYKGKNVQEIGADVQKNLVYPKSAKDQKISAKIFVQFVIDENGKVTDIEVVRTDIVDNSGKNILIKDYKQSSNSEIDAKSVADLEAESVRAVKYLDDFTPAQKDGKNVKTQFTIPVSFILL
jgi:protein TonB